MESSTETVEVFLSVVELRKILGASSSSSLSDVACLRFVECTEFFATWTKHSGCRRCIGRERRFRRAIAERVFGVGLEDKCQMILGSVNGR